MADPREVGERFRHAREARQMTIEEVAKRTHISLRYLHAIEQGDLNNLPETIYIRGFVKKYAELLDLPSQELLSAYPSHPHEVPLVHTPSKPATPHIDYVPVFGVFAVIVIFVGAYWLATPRIEIITASPDSANVASASAKVKAPSKPPASSNPRSAASPRVSKPVAAPGSSTRPSTASPSTQGTQAVRSHHPATTPQPSFSKQPTRKASAAPSPKATPARLVTIAFKLRDDCWLQVLVDGQNKLEGLYQVGAERSFTGRHIEFTAGNGAGARLYRNGEDLGMLGARGEVVTRHFRP